MIVSCPGTTEVLTMRRLGVFVTLVVVLTATTASAQQVPVKERPLSPRSIDESDGRRESEDHSIFRTGLELASRADLHAERRLAEVRGCRLHSRHRLRRQMVP